MGSVQIIGLDKLEKQLKKNATLNDVKKVVKQNGAGLHKKSQRNVPVDSGTLKRSIGLELSDGGMTAEVEATAEYSEYVEYGTRYMDAQPYIRPALKEQERQFKSDMKKLVN